MPVHCHLEKLLEERGMSYRELSDRIGMSHVGLWKVANGKSNPSLETIGKICRALQCEVGDLLSMAATPPPM